MDDQQTPGTRGRFSRRAFLRLTMASSGATLLAACGGGATTPAASDATAGAPAAPTSGAAVAPTAAVSAPATVAPSSGQTTVAWFNPYTTKTTQEALPIIIAEFEKQNP